MLHHAAMDADADAVVGAGDEHDYADDYRMGVG